MGWTRLIDFVIQIAFEALDTEIVTTLQIRYLRDRFFIVANFTFKGFLVSLEELSIDLLHPPLIVVLLSIDIIQFFLFMLVEWVLPSDLIEIDYIAYFKSLQVFLMLGILLIASPAFVVFLGRIRRRELYVVSMGESSWRHMFLFF